MIFSRKEHFFSHKRAQHISFGFCCALYAVPFGSKQRIFLPKIQINIPDSKRPECAITDHTLINTIIGHSLVLPSLLAHTSCVHSWSFCFIKLNSYNIFFNKLSDNIKKPYIIWREEKKRNKNDGDKILFFRCCLYVYYFKIAYGRMEREKIFNLLKLVRMCKFAFYFGKSYPQNRIFFHLVES